MGLSAGELAQLNRTVPVGPISPLVIIQLLREETRRENLTDFFYVTGIVLRCDVNDLLEFNWTLETSCFVLFFRGCRIYQIRIVCVY